MKNLSEMTLEELWKLFPIQLVEPSSKDWKSIYSIEKNILEQLLPFNINIYHIGSTAINGIWTKPIVDILIEAQISDYQKINETLSENEYNCMAKSDNTLDFNKGYNPNGFADEVFHIHVKEHGSTNEIYFRDYINEHREVALEYEKLKLDLWKKYEYDRDEYTKQKTDFVELYTNISKLRLTEVWNVISKFEPKIQLLFYNLRCLVFRSIQNNSSLHLKETTWANLPSYYVGDRFIRIIPFKDHINIEASAILLNRDKLNGFKITPKGMLQIYLNQEIPKEELIKIFFESLN